MSKYYHIEAFKVDGNVVDLAISTTSSDAKGISPEGGLEQWPLAFMIELNEELLDEPKDFEVDMENHPYKEKFQELYWMKMGKKFNVTESEINASTYEGKVIVNRFSFSGRNILIARPDYKEFCEVAKEYFEVKSFEENGDNYAMTFEAKDPNMIYHLREGMEWDSIAYNMWDMLKHI